jgi:hypothetical protein
MSKEGNGPEEALTSRMEELRLLGACPSSGGIFGTNLIPFEA